MTVSLPGPRLAVEAPSDRLEVIVEPPAQDKRDRSHRKNVPFWRQHPAITLSVALISAAVLRVYIMCGADFAETMVVLRVADRSQLLIATVADLIVTLLAIATLGLPMLAVAARDVAHPGARLFVKYYWIAFIVLYMLCVARTSLVDMLAIAALSFFVRWVMYPLCILRYRKRKDRQSRAWAASFGIVSAMAMTATWNVATTPSAGMEELSIKGGTVVSSVWIMGEESGQLVVMHEGSRLEWIPTDDIEGRTLCSVPMNDGEARAVTARWLRDRHHPKLADLVTRPSAYPPCR